MRSSLPLASDRIIIKSSHGAAVYPDQLTFASTATDVSKYLIFICIKLHFGQSLTMCNFIVSI